MVIAFLCSLPIPFIMYTGEAAEEKYEAAPETYYLDDGFEDPLHVHYERAEIGAKAIYAIIVSSALGLVLWKKEKARKVLVWITLLLCLASIPLSIWIAKPGGEIRRPDFRQSSP